MSDKVNDIFTFTEFNGFMSIAVSQFLFFCMICCLNQTHNRTTIACCAVHTVLCRERCKVQCRGLIFLTECSLVHTEASQLPDTLIGRHNITLLNYVLICQHRSLILVFLICCSYCFNSKAVMIVTDRRLKS